MWEERESEQAVWNSAREETKCNESVGTFDKWSWEASQQHYLPWDACPNEGVTPVPSIIAIDAW